MTYSERKRGYNVTTKQGTFDATHFTFISAHNMTLNFIALYDLDL